MKILQVFASLNIGGAESRMIDVYENIDRTQIQFDFLTMQTKEQYYEKKINELGGHIIKILPPRENGSISNLKIIYTVLKNGKYNAVHAHTSFHCGLVMLAAWLADVPVRISHARTTNSKRVSLQNKLALIIGKILIKLFATKALAISLEAGNYLFTNSTFEILPNAINIKKYQSVRSEQVLKLKKDFHLENCTAIIGMVGRFDAMKNHKFIIHWFADYIKKNNTTKLVLVGDGPYRKKIEELIHKFSLQEYVICTGVRSDVQIWMNVFNLLVVPSIFEGFSGVILEAQAAGVPVVKSDSFTNAADLGINMVKSVSLHDMSLWTEAVLLQLALKIPNATQRNLAFESHGYSLTSEIKTLTKLYAGK